MQMALAIRICYIDEMHNRKAKISYSAKLFIFNNILRSKN